MKESKRLPGIEIYNHLKLGNFVQFEYEEERFPGEVPQLDPKKKRLKIKAMAMAGVKKQKSPEEVDEILYRHLDLLKPLIHLQCLTLVHHLDH